MLNDQKIDTLQNDKTTAAEAVAAIKTAPVTSAKLTALELEYKVEYAKMSGLTDMAAMQAGMLETFKIGKLINDEIAAIKTAPVTSAKLTALELEYKVEYAKMSGLTDMAAMQAGMLETFKIGKLIADEIAAIKTADKLAELELAKNARIELVTNLLTSHAAKIAVDADKKSSDDQRNIANDAYNAAKDVVTNELLARYATSKPAAKSADGTDKPAGVRGATGADIIALHTANIDKGMTSADSKAAIVAGGHSRGTTGAVVLAWEKEQGLK